MESAASMNCLLCNKSHLKLAKSHILPIGFFKNMPQKGRIDTVRLDGIKGRKLRKAIYDSEIICPSCEEKILQPLDDYAIKVLRDRQNSSEIKINKGTLSHEKIILYENLDTKKLSLFLASILWRISVSKQPELKELSIGRAYEDRISKDLIEGNSARYIDVGVQFLTHKLHQAFLAPYKERIKPVDYSRDAQTINGWAISLPNIFMRLSLDKRPHPQIGYYKLSPEITGKEGYLLASTSLHAGEHGYKFFALQSEKNDNPIRLMADALRKNKEISKWKPPNS